FDGSPVTRWKSWQSLYPGMYMAVDFGKPEISDSVLLECPFDWEIRLSLEGMTAEGTWKKLVGGPQHSLAPLPPGFRRAATREAKARGIEYFLAYDTDWYADDYKNRSDEWGFRLLGEYNGARLYHLE